MNTLDGDWSHAQFDDFEITGKPVLPLTGTMTGSSQWADAFHGVPMKSYQCDSFPEVKAAKVRLLVEETNGKEPSVFEF